MIDEKRLAELMKPEKMRALADMLARVCGSASTWAAARNLSGTLAQGMDALDCAAAVLREVAGRDAVVTEDDAARAMVEMTTRDDAPAPPGSDADLIADLREQLAHLEDSARRQLFRGNTRGHWYDKAQAYGNICSDLAGILRGQPGDDSRDQARKLVRRVAELEAIASNPADSIRDGIAQAFAEMPDQIYNAISEAVFSHLQKHGIQCPKAGR